MRRLEHDRGGHARFERLLPASRNDAPAIARLQPGEHPLRLGRDEVVPTRHRELQELLGHDGAHDVEADVRALGVAVPVAVEARHRIEATGLELAAEDVHEDELTPSR